MRWFIILLEFDFTVRVRLGKYNLRADHSSRITNGESPTRVDDDLLDTTLFQVEIAPKWVEHIIRILSIDYQAIPKVFSNVGNTLRTIERYILIS